MSDNETKQKEGKAHQYIYAFIAFAILSFVLLFGYRSVQQSNDFELRQQVMLFYYSALASICVTILMFVLWLNAIRPRHLVSPATNAVPEAQAPARSLNPTVQVILAILAISIISLAVMEMFSVRINTHYFTGCGREKNSLARQYCESMQADLFVPKSSQTLEGFLK